MPWICEVSSSMPGGARISICGWVADTSMSISLSSSSPSRSFLRNLWRVTLSSSDALNPTSTSRMRSSAASCARVRTRFTACSRVCFTLISTRSRMMVSTSRPT
jgi:hypothetical protein